MPPSLQVGKFGAFLCRRCGDSYTREDALLRHFRDTRANCEARGDSAWLKGRIAAWCKVLKFNRAVDPPGRRTFTL